MASSPASKSVAPSQFLANTDMRKPHHKAFYQAALERLIALEPTALDRDGELYGIWAAAAADKEPLIPQGAPGASATAAKPADPAKSVTTAQAPSKRILEVPYEYQNDNRSGSGYRECFSSSCAMVAKFFGKVKSDDEYNGIRARFGDSTDAGAHVRALASLGLTAQLKQNGTAQTLEKLILEGRPVPVGWLHKGSVSHPSGGGHWSVVIGFDSKSFIHNDPNGEANMVGGGYVSTSSHTGRGVVYSRANWLKRWEVDGRGTGWYMDIRKP